VVWASVVEGKNSLRRDVSRWVIWRTWYVAIPETQEQLRRLSEKLDLLAAKGSAPGPLSSFGPKAMERIGPRGHYAVLSESVEPMRMKDIHAEVERELGQLVSRSAVKNWLANHVQGDQALFLRLGRGRYLMAPLGAR
jgi:hypothetical protein